MLCSVTDTSDLHLNVMGQILRKAILSCIGGVEKQKQIVLLMTNAGGQHLGKRYEGARWEDLRPNERIKEKAQL